MLCLAQVALTPLACSSFSIPMICSSLNLLFISFCSFYLSRTTLFNCPAFGGQANATFRLTSERLILTFQNVVNRDALQTVAEAAGRAHLLFEDTDFLEHAIGIAAHISFRDEQQRKNGKRHA